MTPRPCAVLISPVMTDEASSDNGVRRFLQSCAYCGARSEITLPREPAATLQVYQCPECGKESEARSALPPLVRLVAPRTDGKSDAYQETLF